MRSTRLFAVLLPILGLWSGMQSLRAAPISPVQSIFLGQRDCGDQDFPCLFPSVTPEHRFLHVVLHDFVGNDEWQVQSGVSCTGELRTVLGGQQVDSTGYLEGVVDLAPAGLTAPLPTLCFVFKGRNHYWATYYAAYLDDNPLADSVVVYPGYQSLGGRPDRPDLDVQYIHRSPAYAYDGTKTGPALNDQVTFTAHVSNAGALSAPAFGYRWLLDGHELLAGTHSEPLEPGASLTFSLPWQWQNWPHDLRFEVSPGSDEIYTGNDNLTIRTNALTLGFWIEQSAYTHFEHNQWLYCSTLPCSGSDSFADWLQRQISTWNAVLAGSVYSEVAPAGIVDRVRLDQITVVPDGSLPLHGGLPTNNPDSTDHTVDLQWGIVAKDVSRTYRLQWENPFDVDWGLLHELGHARSLADLYRFDIPITGDFAFNFVGIDGRPVFDTQRPFDPSNKIRAFIAGQKETFLYQNKERDLMSCTCTPSYSAYSAVVLNRLRNRRASCGNANPPCNLGDWFRDLPPVNRIKILEPDGSPVRDGTTVKAYFDQGSSYTAHHFDTAHSTSFGVSGGTIQLEADPFRARDDRWAAGHNLLLLDIGGKGGEELCFVEPTDFNMAYWSGYRTADHPAVYTLRLGSESQNGCNLQAPPALVNEPFAASPYVSDVKFGRPHKSGKRRLRQLTLHLKDDMGKAMVRRDIRIQGTAGKALASGTTDSNGILQVSVPAHITAVDVDDVTDNNLTFRATDQSGSG